MMHESPERMLARFASTRGCTTGVLTLPGCLPERKHGQTFAGEGDPGAATVGVHQKGTSLGGQSSTPDASMN
jgi:hypothetical protein